MLIYKGKSILVAGGAGFIGSHIARNLLQMGAKVTIADDLSSGSLANVQDINKRADVRIVDTRKMNVCKELTKEKDYVFQFAANMGGIGYITTVGADIMRDNALININLLQCAVENKVKRYFFSSSACIYPVGLQTTTDVVPLKEADAMPADPNEFYGWEKLMCEKLCEAYHKDYGLDVRVARFHNVFGEAYTAFDPLRGKSPAHLVMKTLRYPREKFVLWGDGKQTRSFLYIEDCVKGVLKLMESDCREPLNIGSDRMVSMDEMVTMLGKISGKKIKVKHDLTKPQGVRGRNADLTLVRKALGWEPEVSLEQGMARLYHWASERLPQIDKVLAESGKVV